MTEYEQFSDDKPRNASQDKTSTLAALPFLTPDWRYLGDFLVEVKNQTFKRHALGEASAMVGIRSAPNAGTSFTAPWVFSRLFVFLFLAFLALLTAAAQEGVYIIPLMLFVGASIGAVPAAIFILEANALRDISLYRFGFMAVVGGGAVMLLVQFMPVWTFATTEGRVFFAITEEILKLAAVVLLTLRASSGGILNGLAFGAAVGAGFAVIETAGYLLRFGGAPLEIGLLTEVALNRGWMTVGAHVMFTAVVAAALWSGRPMGSRFSWPLLVRPPFLITFTLVAILHVLWNLPVNAFPLWIAITIATVYLGLTYVVAGRQQAHEWVVKSELGPGPDPS